MRDEPRNSSVTNTGVRGEILANIASTIINSYQAGELQVKWQEMNITNGIVPNEMSVQEPFDYSTVELVVIDRIELVIPPDQCREQSPCGVQPVLVAYDSNNTVIQKLGSNDRPWQVRATIINQTNVRIGGAIANYSDGQTQYTLFSLSQLGAYQIRFNIISPDGVSTSFFQTANLSVKSASIEVSNAIPDGEQDKIVSIVNVNSSFSVRIKLVDEITRLPLVNVRWGNWTWTATVTLHSLTKYNAQGTLIQNGSIVVDVDAKVLIMPVLKITAIGMYVLNIHLMSTNNEYEIALSSNGILVKDPNDISDGERNDFIMMNRLFFVFLIQR